jgi:hypothetical protein
MSVLARHWLDADPGERGDTRAAAPDAALCAHFAAVADRLDVVVADVTGPHMARCARRPRHHPHRPRRHRHSIVARHGTEAQREPAENPGRIIDVNAGNGGRSGWARTLTTLRRFIYAAPAPSTSITGRIVPVNLAGGWLCDAAAALRHSKLA